MITLKGPPEHHDDAACACEGCLARLGLAAVYPNASGTVFGCFTYYPGRYYNELADALSGQSLLGVLGLAFDEAAMLPWAGLPAVRDLFGKLLLSAGTVHVWSSVSREWALHYGIPAVVVGHPAWLAPLDSLKSRLPTSVPVVRDNIGEAIACALLQRPAILYVPRQVMQHFQPQAAHPLVQFAQTYDCLGNVVFNEEDLAKKLAEPDQLVTIRPEVIERAQHSVRVALEEMLRRQAARTASTQATSTLLAAFQRAHVPLVSDAQPNVAPAANLSTQAIPRLITGEPFDPKRHYSEAYFGKGIEYTKADDTTEVYYGPARHWDGFDTVARTIADLLLGKDRDRRLRLLDIGCGYADFVTRARKDPRLEAYGVDLSEDVISGIIPPIRPYITIGDIVDPQVRARLSGPFHVITTWDFWEHIFEVDVDALVQALFELMAPGGLMFNIICTRAQNGIDDFVLPKGGLVTKENSWALVSGHVNIRTWDYWVKKLCSGKPGFKPRFDAGHMMLAALVDDVHMRRALGESWSPRNFLVVGKPAK